MALHIETRARGVFMADLLKPVGVTTANCLAPGVTLFQRYLDDAAQQALAGEVSELVSQAPWFVPRMPRSGKAFSVKMTNCGCLGWVSDRDGGYRYQATHPFNGCAWPAIPLSVLNIWRALASYGHPPEACLINFYDFSARMGLHQDRDEEDLAAPVVSISLGDSYCFRYGGLRRSDPAKKTRIALRRYCRDGRGRAVDFPRRGQDFCGLLRGCCRAADGSISPCGG